MSLLATASPFNSENDNNNDNDIAVRRQQSHNRTLKQRKENNTATSNIKHEMSLDENEELAPVRPNVAAMMKALNNSPPDDSGLADFNPPSNSELTKAPLHKNIGKQGFTNLAQVAPYEYDENNHNNNNNNNNNEKLLRSGGPKANDDRSVDHSKYNSLPSNYANAYYQQLMHGNNIQNLSSNLQNLEPENYQVLNERLNHIIHLLEEQQNSKTNSVTEELILYCFLGVFVIFIVDSFARVGKYSR